MWCPPGCKAGISQSLWCNRYNPLRKAHVDILAGFDEEMEALSAVDLHPATQTSAHTKLVHLVDAPKLRNWAKECRICHENLAQKVGRIAWHYIFGQFCA